MSSPPSKPRRRVSTPEGGHRPLWRVFPWDPGARGGARFSPSFLPKSTGRGRFDLPRTLSDVLYLAETPDHAVGEALQPWRNRSLKPYHLIRAGLPLALVEVTLPMASVGKLADLCDPAHLAETGPPPDRAASRLRERTQPLAWEAWEAGHHGLRWWSSFWGDWHTVVLFTARMPEGLRFGAPVTLGPDHPAVTGAADLLGMS